MIDNKGKLFGIINVIDLFIILVVVLAAVFVGKKLMTGTTASSATKKVELRFFTEEVNSFAADYLEIGGRVEDEGKSIFLGNITDFTVGDGYTYYGDQNGEVHKTYKEGFSAIEIATELDAQMVPGGIVIDGNVYGVNHSLTIRAGQSKIFVRVSGIKEIN